MYQVAHGPKDQQIAVGIVRTQGVHEMEIHPWDKAV